MEQTELKVRLKYMKPLRTENFTFSPIGDNEVTEYDLEKARTDLGETEEKKIKGLKVLKTRLARDKRVKYRTDDLYLLHYLLYGKFNCDVAYKAIHKLYTLRSKYPEYFALTPKLEYLLKTGIVCYWPYKDEERRLLSCVNFRNWNVEEISLCDFMQTFNAVADIMSTNFSLQFNGLVTVWDLRGLTLRHLMQAFYTSSLQVIFSTFQEIYPTRPKLIIGIYCNSVSRTIYNIIRPVLKKKIAGRIKLLGSDMSELHRYVNPLILPKEYGGMLEEEECMTAQFILDNLPYLKYERSFGFIKET